METSQAERTFYQDANVNVTQSRFVVGSKTYAMRNISSVSLYRIESSKVFQIIIIAIGVFLLFDGDTSVVGILMTIAGGVWLYFTRDSYAVRISTNAGETNSLTSTNKEYINKIVDALNDAIIQRG